MGGRELIATIADPFNGEADITFLQPTGDNGPVYIQLNNGETIRVDKPVNDRCGGILNVRWIERFYA